MGATPEGLLYTSVSATLTTAAEVPIPGAVISFTTGGGGIGSATTNANGVATFNLFLRLSLGGTYQVHYSGSANYAASVGSAAL